MRHSGIVKLGIKINGEVDQKRAVFFASSDFFRHTLSNSVSKHFVPGKQTNGLSVITDHPSLIKLKMTQIYLKKTKYYGIIDKDCPSLSLRHGEVKEYWRGRLVVFRCNLGYSLVDGDKYRRCTSCGVWTGRLPRCEGLN